MTKEVAPKEWRRLNLSEEVVGAPQGISSSHPAAPTSAPDDTSAVPMRGFQPGPIVTSILARSMEIVKLEESLTTGLRSLGGDVHHSLEWSCELCRKSKAQHAAVVAKLSFADGKLAGALRKLVIQDSKLSEVIAALEVVGNKAKLAETERDKLREELESLKAIEAQLRESESTARASEAVAKVGEAKLKESLGLFRYPSLRDSGYPDAEAEHHMEGNEEGKTHHFNFEIRSAPCRRLCKSKEILTVNGEFPGPTLKIHTGDSMFIRVHNIAKYNITLHWHGIKQERNPWSDGPEYITQCPIQPGKKFKYRVKNVKEEGTVWWHAHSGWARATVHGMIIIYPKPTANYPFPTPLSEIPIILGEWWKRNVIEIPNIANKTGGEPALSDAYTINGQPGHLYPCSSQGMFTTFVEHGKTYLLRILNVVMDEELFFGITNHKLQVVAIDGHYTKPFTTSYILITPGQTIDVLVKTDQFNGSYFMAARSYSSAFGAGFDNSTTTALLNYEYDSQKITNQKLPILPPYNATKAANDFITALKRLVTKKRPITIPSKIDTRLFLTISVNLLNCSKAENCTGPLGKRFSSSINNISFITPNIDILSAYYYNIKGVFTKDFPKNPPIKFNYTGDTLPESLLTPEFGTKVMVLEYDAKVELVLQGTNILASDNHPIHLHGYSFYVVGYGIGNFDPSKDPQKYNLVDPPEQTTVAVPKNGWAALRFRANNPGVWLMHCHLERHQSWGMNMVFLVKDGPTSTNKIVHPPPDLPAC
ncbi:hypothetical protein RND81_06G191900 [Saponaria officinalis]|uniref:Laccase n=1 Tax=Saponaria officinalis TaxID=3572 RepID=A0AAW1KDB0_SAPOF